MTRIYRAKINCVHLDNYNRCCVKQVSKWVRWFIPKGRIMCPIQCAQNVLFQDESDKPRCTEQLKSKRPNCPPPRIRQKEII